MKTKNNGFKAVRWVGFAIVVAAGLAFAGSAKAETVTFSVRYQDALLVDHVAVAIPATGVVSLSTQDGVQRQVNTKSVLGILASLDEENNSFGLSKLTYYATFQSVYLNCVFVQSSGTDACENWLYAVNGQDPQVGMDSYVPQAGSQVFVYFGISKRVSAPSTTSVIGTPFTLTAQKYAFESNTWDVLTGVTIGITRPNLENPFSPIEVATGAVDGVGNAVFTIGGIGQYDAGIKEDYYTFKLPISIYNPFGGVIAAGGGTAVGGTVPPTQEIGERGTVPAVRIDEAVAFLASRQDSSGSLLGSQRLTDWGAVALGADNPSGDAASKARSYLLTNPNPGSLLTDWERRAMALMALGVNPYSGTPTDYIAKIASQFDGTQLGDPALFNDDIFGLLVLLRAGYAASDPVVAKTIEFVLSKQQSSGAFVDVDMTAAAVQALSLTREAPGVADALQKAKAYLVARRGVDGGFGGNVASSSWAAQALTALGEDASETHSYLATKQAEDGGWILGEADESRVWETSYAIPAALQKPWGALLQSFSKSVAVGGTVPPTQKPVAEVVAGPPSGADVPATAGRVVFENAQTVAGVNSSKAALMIPAGVELKQENGSEWTGTIEVTAALALEEVIHKVADSKAGEKSMTNLAPKGFVTVQAGEGVRVQASKPMLVSIPVFSENGATLAVYRRSAGEKDFSYIDTCVVDQGACVVSTDHLSEFVAVSAVGGTVPPTQKPVASAEAVGGPARPSGGQSLLSKNQQKEGLLPIVAAEEDQVLLVQEEEAPLTAGVMKVSSQRMEFLYVVLGTFLVLGAGYATLWFLEKKKLATKQG